MSYAARVAFGQCSAGERGEALGQVVRWTVDLDQSGAQTTNTMQDPLGAAAIQAICAMNQIRGLI
jgi:hypothetical protein